MSSRSSLNTLFLKQNVEIIKAGMGRIRQRRRRRSDDEEEQGGGGGGCSDDEEGEEEDRGMSQGARPLLQRLLHCSSCTERRSEKG